MQGSGQFREERQARPSRPGVQHDVAFAAVRGCVATKGRGHGREDRVGNGRRRRGLGLGLTLGLGGLVGLGGGVGCRRGAPAEGARKGGTSVCHFYIYLLLYPPIRRLLVVAVLVEIAWEIAPVIFVATAAVLAVVHVIAIVLVLFVH